MYKMGVTSQERSVSPCISLRRVLEEGATSCIRERDDLFIRGRGNLLYKME